jgi:3-hydroxyacyl-CoA dehydrogenase
VLLFLYARTPDVGLQRNGELLLCGSQHQVLAAWYAHTSLYKSRISQGKNAPHVIPVLDDLTLAGYTKPDAKTELDMPYATPCTQSIKNVAIIGSGSIGASWAALCLAQGVNVRVYDINSSARGFLYKLVTSALPTLESLGRLKNAKAKADDILFTTDLEVALEGVDLVQENGPENLEFKQNLFTNIAKHVRDDVIIATSSSGLMCSKIQEGMPSEARPERCVVGHPFNPPHLIPLVEVVGGELTSKRTIERMMDFYDKMGKQPVYVQKEVPGHIANRLQAALFREIFNLVANNVCTVHDIDTAMANGPGLRWGVMGPSALMHLAGGEGGVEHMADHLLQPMTTWWSEHAPSITDTLKKKWVAGTLDAIDGKNYLDLSKQRDDEIVDLLNSRKKRGTSGSTLRGENAKRLFILDTDLSQLPDARGSIKSCNTDGSDLKTVIGDMTNLPDGIVMDPDQEYMYWTNMGTSLSSNSGSIERARLDGLDREVIVPQGNLGVHTPKQIALAQSSKKLYWCDREGMKVCRSDTNGSNIECLVDTSSSPAAHPQCQWCVGIAVDEARGYFYWSQKGPPKGRMGRIFRAPINKPNEHELLFDELPEPIDLEIDEQNAMLYWTDRGDPPTGNSLNRAMVTGEKRKREILATRLHEAIGLALDRDRSVCYVTDLAGAVYEVDIETKEKRVLFSELGDLTGVALT